jgi:hypothetical protein
MLKKILIALATWMALVLAVGFMLPSKYRVERSTIINAPAKAVYAQVAHLKSWRDWSPWNASSYPSNQWMFGGPEVGVGAVRSWSGEDVGTGTLSLTQADPETGVSYDMSLKDGRYLLHGRISFSSAGQGTRVTWVDEGDLGGGPLMPYLRFPLQSRLGRDLEQALARLKTRVEAGSLPANTEPEPGPMPAPAQATAPSREPAPAPVAPAAPAPVEGSPPATPSTQGAHAATSGEAPPSVVVSPAPTGEPAQTVPGPSVPTGEPAPAEATPAAPPASEPAPAPAEAQTTPTAP